MERFGSFGHSGEIGKVTGSGGRSGFGEITFSRVLEAGGQLHWVNKI